MAAGTTVKFAGSTGKDYSSHQDLMYLPNLGDGFGASGPWANYVLVATLPANPDRQFMDIENISGGPILVLFDDGEAQTGAALQNVSAVPLSGGSGVGVQGGSISDSYFKGRAQVFAPASTAIVTVFER